MFWQNLIVLIIVLGSCIYLARRLYFSISGNSSGCGSACNGCSAGDKASEDQNLVQLVQIEPSPKKHEVNR
ncbi:MAG: hypothetical protein COA78_33945 [Blastopirellula sp.]|nr:MAG: hypothetical protein COA78_33945 [Blastopirellula sp.]